MNIEYKVVRSAARRKSAMLKILPDGTIQVRAPIFMSNNFIEQFVQKNSQWIELQATKNTFKPKQVINGELWPYLGEVYPLKIISTRLRPKVEIDNQLLIMRVNAGTSVILRKKLVINWYKKHARAMIVDLVKKYTTMLEKKYGVIRLKDTSSRWGSCSSEGNLNFNWRLILAPEKVLEYVVIHEVCHLVHPHHKPTFWRLVEAFDPEYRKSRTYLKHHGWKLNV